MFGHLLHWYPTADQYAELTQLELSEMRRVCKDLTRKR